ncbi:MAG: organic solvent tolerance protein OstA [Planctomycetota bacterium]
MPPPAAVAPVTIRADTSSRWTEGGYEVRRLQGQVSIAQGETVARGDDAVVWVHHADRYGKPTRVLAYLEAGEGRQVVVAWAADEGGDKAASAENQATRQESPNWSGRFVTTASVDWRTPEPTGPPSEPPGIYARGAERLGFDSTVLARQLNPQQAVVDPQVQPAQFGGVPFGPPPGPVLATPTVPPPGPVVANPNGFRSVRINPRSNVGARAEFRPMPGGESVAVISGGVNVIVEGIEVEGLPTEFGPIDKIDLETDRAVIWTAGDVGVGGNFQQQNDAPLEIYMEGNIVFRQGGRTVYADRMYYDVRRRTGVILGAELLTPLPDVNGFEYGGLIRLKAGVIRQLGDARFVATDALVTTSRLEEPTYALRSGTITLEDNRRPVVEPSTGLVTFESDRLVRSEQNRVTLGSVPVLAWPTIATNLEEPTFYISDLRIRNDSIFGTQLLTEFNAYQVFGLEPLAGTNWDISLDYLSDRGFGYGTEFEYDRNSFAGINGPAIGRLDAWAIDDGGVDNLGFGRREITPEQGYRGRIFWNHRQQVVDGLLAGWVVQGEVGWISDRTFLEQYYEAEWDENPDQNTGVRLRRRRDNRSLSIEANGRINDFFTQTQWLPRLDHYILGQDVLSGAGPLGNRGLTWFAHTTVGYANQQVASTPTEPTLAGLFNLYPWETVGVGGGGARIDGSGERIATRHELDLPIAAGKWKVVPFVLGEFAHWGADVNGEDLQRAYVHTGVRASLPFWTVNPAIIDPLFNLNGLAHKVVLDAEFSFTDANENYDQLPLYDAIDDDAIEEIRRSLFGPPFPVRFDPRFYAIRTGIQGVVASPSTELVEDQMAVRLGMRHRLQTKRGAAGRQNIVDWVTFDTNLTFFPDANRDNFGEDIGLIDYDLAWHLGDRFTIVSDGFADVFDDGLRTISGGLRTGRPLRGNAFIGYRTIRGPFEADLLTASLAYRLSPKWVASGSTVIDFGDAGNIGQSIAFSRIGESIILSLGANVDESKDNIGFSFLIEPRFLPRSNLTRKTGIVIPPAGIEYLE